MAAKVWTRKEVEGMLKDPKFGTAILGTHAGDEIDIRPMMVRIRDNGEIYFVAHKMTAKVAQIRANPNATLQFGGYAMTTDINEAWIHMNAKIVICEDLAKKQAAWLPFLAHMYPSGYTDPNMILLEVHPTKVSIAQPGRKTPVPW
eukprot:TRINITY_DN1013_c0_g1_i2.p1 TRINITY_DN1013_c0_g1~~TRINITY_DN1013_c0_g1_i2.p1  ORF type:complete len:146 (-),score=39.57 TRINITY_DN1013_c0_g1_i2:106-543(-)